MRFMKTQAGFTLLETIVAISVLMLGVVGPLSLIQRNLKASRSASDRLVASFLAQEGIEAVRSVIANNSADTSDYSQWLNDVTDPPGQCDNANRCIFDVALSYASNPLRACPGGCSRRMYQNTEGVYRQSRNDLSAWGTATKFSRDISVIVVEPGKRITASTTVWWTGGNITLQEDIYNWFIQLN